MKRENRLLLLALVINSAITGVAVIIYPSPSSSGGLDGEYLFTFAHVSDSHYPKLIEINEEVIQWLAKQDNISFIVHTGDFVDNAYDETAWENAYELIHRLGNKSWSLLAGNHDVGEGRYSTNYEKYFGNNSFNQYFIVEDEILFILLGWNNVGGSISQERLEWVDTIIQNHETMQVVVCLHPHLFGPIFFNILGVPNFREVWNLLDRHDNVIMTISGHFHLNWVKVHKGEHEIWAMSTEALMNRGYIRLFDVYQDRIEAYAYSPWTNRKYYGTLDRFTISLNTDNHDVDGDLWPNVSDIMPTHPLVPNGILLSVIMTITLLAYWIRKRTTCIRKSNRDIETSE